MVERVLAVPEVRGSIPGLGRFRVYHFRNVQHNTKVPTSYMVAQAGFVLHPYGPGLRELGDLWCFAHISGGVYEVHGVHKAHEGDPCLVMLVVA